jgi:hypothetical protein
MTPPQRALPGADDGQMTRMFDLKVGARGSVECRDCSEHCRSIVKLGKSAVLAAVGRSLTAAWRQDNRQPPAVSSSMALRQAKAGFKGMSSEKNFPGRSTAGLHDRGTNVTVGRVPVYQMPSCF